MMAGGSRGIQCAAAAPADLVEIVDRKEADRVSVLQSVHRRLRPGQDPSHGGVAGRRCRGGAWLKSEKQTPEHILFVGPDNSVVGAGETTIDRPDVPKAVPEVTISKVGRRGIILAASGQMRAFAALPDGRSARSAPRTSAAAKPGPLWTDMLIF